MHPTHAWRARGVLSAANGVLPGRHDRPVHSRRAFRAGTLCTPTSGVMIQECPEISRNHAVRPASSHAQRCSEATLRVSDIEFGRDAREHEVASNAPTDVPAR